MLGFILSKLNLLILVVAIFAIVSFFAFNLIDIVKVYEGRLLLDQLSSKAFALASSPAYCFSDSYDLPRSIVVGGDEVFYVVKISKQSVNITNPDGTQAPITVVIFSLIPRVQYLQFIRGDLPNEPPSVAASSFRTSASVNLYSPDYLGEEYGDTGASFLKGPDDPIFIDPNTRQPYNTLEFRKEIRSGLEYVYFFPCSTVGQSNCDIVKNNIACMALPANASGGCGDFQC